MNNAKRFMLILNSISTIIDSFKYEEPLTKSEIEELEDALAMAGLDWHTILYKLPPYQALQVLCAELSLIDVTQEEIEALLKEGNE